MADERLCYHPELPQGFAPPAPVSQCECGANEICTVCGFGQMVMPDPCRLSERDEKRATQPVF